MRTTLDIDSDVLTAVKGLARRSGETAGKVLSELAREALTGSKPSEGVAEEPAFYGFKPLAAKGRLVSDETVERLREREGV
ncbi:MAG: antitoxin [Rhodanobacteraceae bacterium]|nr:MAG: antitoxin [Rhodanobacteraceae bacterium]